MEQMNRHAVHMLLVSVCLSRFPPCVSVYVALTRRSTATRQPAMKTFCEFWPDWKHRWVKKLLLTRRHCPDVRVLLIETNICFGRPSSSFSVGRRFTHINPHNPPTCLDVPETVPHLTGLNAETPSCILLYRSRTTCGPALLPPAPWSRPACCPAAPRPAWRPTLTPLARPPAPPITATWPSLISRTSSATSPLTTSSARTRCSRRPPTGTMPSRPSLSLKGARPASLCCAWRPRSTRPTFPGPCDGGSCIYIQNWLVSCTISNRLLTQQSGVWVERTD